VVFLRVTALVVDLLSNQEQDAVAADAVISLHTLNQDIMVGHNDSLQPRFYGSLRNILVGARPVGVDRVHVQINDNFVHETSSIGFRQSLACLEKTFARLKTLKLTVFLPSRYNVSA
jgi:hypothetical protein